MNCHVLSLSICVGGLYIIHHDTSVGVNSNIVV